MGWPSDEYGASEGRWKTDLRKVRRELKFMIALKKEGHDVDETFVRDLYEILYRLQEKG